MFEREINQTIQTLAAEVLREQTFVPLLSIVEDERIPWRFKPFFTTEVQWWLHNEALSRATNKRFDYSHPELTSLLSYLEQVQFRHARFERDDFLVVLDSAVKLTYNYICRPQTTLKWYIFRGEPVKPLREVMLRFGAFGDYEYFSTVFAEWVERKQSERTTFDAISSTEFERVIRRIDDQILLSCTVEDLLELMSPFFEFISTDPDLGVPIDALVIFFDDKNIKKLVDHLEAYRSRGRTHILRDEFVAVLDELLTASEGEPEADFSTVYQNDELDAVVRQHLTGDQAAADLAAAPAQAPSPATPADLGTPSAAPELPSEPPASVPPQSIQPAVAIEEAQEEMLGQEEIEAEEELEEADFEGGLPTDLNLADLRHHLGAFQETSMAASTGNLPAAEAPAEEIRKPAASAEGSVIQEDEDDDPWPWESPESPAEDTAANIAAIEEEEEVDEVIDDVEIDEIDEVEIGEIDIDAAEDDGAEDDGADGELANQTQPAAPDDEDDDDDDEWLMEIHQHISASASQAATSQAAAPVAAQATAAAPEPTVSLAAEPAPASSVAPPQPVQPAAAPGMSDVRTFIDAMLERKVIKKVFQRNRSEYESVLDKLNSAQNWKIASQILDELFVRNSVDPYSRTAIRFTDSVYGRYLSTNNRS